MIPAKILFIVEDLETGGTERSLYKWIANCDRALFEPVVISFREGVLKKEMEGLKVKIFILTKHAGFNLLFLTRLVMMILRINPDMVHCRNGIPAISYGILAAKICRKPIVSSIHGRSHYIDKGLRTKIWFRIMKLSDVIITVSESIRNEISECVGIDINRVKVVYNGIDTNKNGNLDTVSNKKEYGEKKDYIIGTVGTLRKIKGHQYLVEAMPSILQKIPNAMMLIVGSGGEANNLKQLAAKLGVEERITFLGHRNDAAALMCKFDVFVLPSVSEGFPNVILEAAVNKRPIIATRVGGVCEILEDRYSALLVEKEKPYLIAEKVVELKNDAVLAMYLAENAYCAVKKFSLSNFVNGYSNIYQEILRKKN